MADRCPICYRNLGTFLHDPILLPTGVKYDWDMGVENTLVTMDIGDRWYKGFQQISEVDVVEIQSALHQLEVDNLDEYEWTEFSSVNDTGKFQVLGKHIKEMRDSVEKILSYFSLTKLDYFNYDEEGNHITSPAGDKIEWTDPVENEEDWNKFQVKAIHIEDLRHYIQVTAKIEKWNISPIGIITPNLDTTIDVQGDIDTWHGNITFPYQFSYTPGVGQILVLQRLPPQPMGTSFEIVEADNNKCLKLIAQGGTGLYFIEAISQPGYKGFGGNLNLSDESNIQTYTYPLPTPMAVTETTVFSMLLNLVMQRGYMGWIWNNGGANIHDYIWKYPQFNLVLSFQIVSNQGNYVLSWGIRWDTPIEIGGFYNPAQHTDPDVGIVYDLNIHPTVVQETRDISVEFASINQNLDLTLTWDFWNLLVQHYINNYNKGMDENSQLIPATWTLIKIQLITLHNPQSLSRSGGGLSDPSFDAAVDGYLIINKWDDIGMV